MVLAFNLIFILPLSELYINVSLALEKEFEGFPSFFMLWKILCNIAIFDIFLEFQTFGPSSFGRVSYMGVVELLKSVFKSGWLNFQKFYKLTVEYSHY